MTGRLRDNPIAEAAIYRWGPAVRRVPKPIRDAAVRQSVIPTLPEARIWNVGPLEVASPARPRTLGGELTLSRMAFRRRRVAASFVAELRDAWLVGQHAVPFTSGGRMLLVSARDSIGVLAAERQVDLERWIADGPASATLPDGLASSLARAPACSLVGRLDSNFFHWLVDHCGQVEGLLEYRRQTGLMPTVVIRTGAPSFVHESLSILGLEAGSTIEWPVRWSSPTGAEDGGVVAARVPTLVVSAWRHFRHGCSPASLRWLRRAFLAGAEQAQTEPTRRLYVQRPPGAWRGIDNEDAMLAMLLDRGFHAVVGGERSLFDEIALFQGASVIVGQHGAALTNVLFAPRARLIELSGRYGGPEYFSMCSGLENAYTRVQCEDRGEDIHVDLNVLARALDEQPETGFA